MIRTRFLKAKRIFAPASARGIQIARGWLQVSWSAGQLVGRAYPRFSCLSFIEQTNSR